VPPNAQVAVQQGEAVVRNILATIDGADARLSPLTYRPVGQLVDVGKGFAITEVMGIKFSGLLAYVVWRGTYLFGLEPSEPDAGCARLVPGHFLPLDRDRSPRP
jgi:NADH dehydrogenase